MELLLIPIDDAQQAAFDGDAVYRAALEDGDWPRLAQAMQRLLTDHVLPHAAIATAPGPAHWGGFAALARDTQTVVGSCAFKGAPDASGTVEIAYFTYPGFEGRGVGTAMATALLALAQAQPTVRVVTAHTLPTPSASTRILEKLGLHRVGEVIDPDEGPVWRWQRLSPRAE